MVASRLTLARIPRAMTTPPFTYFTLPSIERILESPPILSTNFHTRFLYSSRTEREKERIGVSFSNSDCHIATLEWNKGRSGEKKKKNKKRDCRGKNAHPVLQKCGKRREYRREMTFQGGECIRGWLDGVARRGMDALCSLELCSLRNTIKSSLRGASLFNGWLTLIEGHASAPFNARLRKKVSPHGISRHCSR